MNKKKDNSLEEQYLEDIDIGYLSRIADKTERSADYLVSNNKIPDFLIPIYILYLNAYETKLKAILAKIKFLKEKSVSKKYIKDFRHNIIKINSQLPKELQIVDPDIKSFLKNNVVMLRYGEYPFVGYSPLILEKLKPEYQKLVKTFANLN